MHLWTLDGTHMIYYKASLKHSEAMLDILASIVNHCNPRPPIAWGSALGTSSDLLQTVQCGEIRAKSKNTPPSPISIHTYLQSKLHIHP